MEGSGKNCGRFLDPTEDEEFGLEPLDKAMDLSERDVRVVSLGESGAGIRLRSAAERDAADGIEAGTEI